MSDLERGQLAIDGAAGRTRGSDTAFARADVDPLEERKTQTAGVVIFLVPGALSAVAVAAIAGFNKMAKYD